MLNGNYTDSSLVFTSQGSGLYFQIDLGRERTIDYVTLYTQVNSYGNAADDLYIRASNDPDFTTSTVLAVTPNLGIKPADNSYHTYIAPANRASYRYVRVSNDNHSGMCVCEIDVHAVASAPEITSILPEGDDVTEASVGSVTFDKIMDKSTLNSTNIVVTDENNNIIPQIKSTVDNQEYRFVCDFEPNKTYTITVGSGVKSAGGMPVEKTSASFTTAVNKSVVKEITPTDVSKYSSSTMAGNPGRFDLLFDNSTTTGYMRNYSGNTWLNADLGAETNLAYIVFYTNERGNGVEIQASNDPSFTTGVVTLATSPVDTANQINGYVAKGQGSYRYVRIRGSQNQGLYICELEIYAYLNTPTVAKILPSGKTLTKASAGKVTFTCDMDRSTLNSSNITVAEVTEGGVKKQHREDLQVTNSTTQVQHSGHLLLLQKNSMKAHSLKHIRHGKHSMKSLIIF